MAGTVTLTEITHTSVKKVSFDWTSSAAGAADGASTEYYTGSIERVVTVPDSGGTQPTDQYDVTVLDDDGADVLFANGANRSNVNTEQIAASNLGIVVNSKLTIHVTNGGNAKGGVLHLYVR